MIQPRLWVGRPAIAARSGGWLAAGIALVLALPGSAAQVLSGHVPAAVAQSRPVGRLAGSTRLNLAIGLPLRNQANLTDLLRQIYDPAGPLYHQYLSPQQFTERFGPTEQDVQTVVDFAKAKGLTVVYQHPNRLVLAVVGSAADIEKAFHVTLRVYQHPTESRTFFAPDSQPSLDLAVQILGISGLDNFSIPRPNLHSKAIKPRAGTGSAPSGGYLGNDFRAAYVPGTSLTGAGQSVGLLEFDGYYPNDTTSYQSQAGLPNVTLINVPVDGGVTNIGSGNSEVALDIDMALSMAPGLSKIYVYEAPNPSPWVDILSRMANDNLSRQLSCSWGGGPPDPSSEQIFQQMAAQGQSFFNASGDSDAFTGAIPFPSDSPNITQVGATTLTTTGPGGAYVSESVWNWGLVNGNYVGSSGGISTSYSLPAYQQGISMTFNQGSTTMRNVPDVALTGDNVYVVYNNGSAAIFGGTSCAAPLWAGLTALINQQAASAGKPAVGFINPAVYALGKGPSFTTAFHDIKTGNNFSGSSPTKFAAVAGYDLCAGWGTPSGTNLINALTVLIIPDSYTLLAESYSPTNGAIDPGETVTLNLTLVNMGPASTANLVATLLPDNGIASPSPPQTYGVLAAGGGTGTQPFTFTANGACGSTITATLQLQDGTANLGTVNFNLQVGRIPIPLLQNFDSVTAPALPPGWTTSSSGAQSVWVTSSSASDMPPNSAFTAGAGAAGVNELDSPVFTISSTGAQLSFRNNYNLQSGSGGRGDGGVLEISIGGGASADILTAGGSFVSGGYVRTLGTSRGNPLGGRQAWSGNSGGFITTVVNLPAAAAGQTVQLKWRCGTDSSTASPGWYIDTITVADGTYVCASPGTDIGISQTASSASPVVSSNFTYTLSVTNQGSFLASNVVVTDTLPAAVAFVSAPPGCAYNAGQVTCALGTLATNTGTNISIAVQATAAGSLTNTATVSSPTDTNLADNTTTLVTAALSLPSLILAPASLSFGCLAVGQSATQSWTVVNGGQTALAGSASVGTPFAVVGGSPFTIAGGQTGYVAVAFSPATASTYSNPVTFSSNGGSSIDSATGAGAYPLAPNFSGTPTNGAVPLTVIFTDTSTGTITNRFFNFGDGVSTNTVSATVQHTYLAPGTNNVLLTVSGPLGSASLTQPDYITAVVAPPVAGFTLSPASGQAPLTVTFTDTSAGNITNRFWDFGDTSTSNTTATTVAHTYNAGTNSVTLIVSSPGGNSTNTQTAAVVATNFVASADLALSVTATPEPVFAGHTLSYTLAVMNLGPQPASGVVVTNSLPATATFVSATLSQGSFTNCGQDVVCNLGSLSNTVVATLVITTTPSAATDTSIITNLASVVANESDPVSANNSARAVSTVWLDSIGDGIPDWWRAQYFGVGNATNAVSCATCDPDGDGFSNLAEFIADTNPTNSASYLALTGIAPVAGGLRLDWQGGSAARQFLQSRFDLFSTNDAWLDVFSNQPPTPLINSVTNPFGTNPLQFFRIRATRF